MTKSRIFTVALFVVLILLAASAWLMFGRTAAGMSYPDADKYTVGNTTVTKPVNNLYVDWTSGQVNIEYHDGDGVIVSETANRELSEDDRLRWWLDGDTLRIRFAKPGFRISVNLDKKLTVSLPKGTVLKSADIGTTSGDLFIPALAADDIRLGSTSGSIDAVTDTPKLYAVSTSGDVKVRQDSDISTVDLGSTSGSVSCTLGGSVKNLEANSTSGSVSLKVAGAAEEVKADSTSGSIYTDLASVNKAEFGSTSGCFSGSVRAFKKLKIHTTSGKVDVKLSTEPGFTCKVDSASGDLTTALSLAKDGNKYTCGDGSAECAIDTTSGDITLGRID